MTLILRLRALYPVRAAVHGSSADLALWTAFAAAFVVTIRDFVERPLLRLLDGISLVLFGLLALGRGFARGPICRWLRCAPSSIAVIGAGHRAIAPAPAIFAAICQRRNRRPRAMAAAPIPAYGQYHHFAAWLAAFTAMTLADAAVTFTPVPLYVGVAVSVIAMGAGHHLDLALSGPPAAQP